jgi:hypothetical protein
MAERLPLALLQALACAVGGRAAEPSINTDNLITDTEN